MSTDLRPGLAFLLVGMLLLTGAAWGAIEEPMTPKCPETPWWEMWGWLRWWR